MREDISEVLIERPRKGARLKDPKGYHRRLQRIPLDELPKGEKIKQKWSDCRRSQTDVLGPLEGWLRKQVGRHWDDIYSEIAANMPQNSMAKSHVRDHIFNDFVALANTIYIENRRVYEKIAREKQRIEYTSYHSRDRFYVHPETGILCKAPKYRFRWQQKPKPYKWVDDQTLHYQLDGVWYEIKVKPVDSPKRPRDFPESHYDTTVSRRVKFHELYQLYGKDVVGVSKRQLNKREIRKANLRAA